jgi:hypothetical protein
MVGGVSLSLFFLQKKKKKLAQENEPILFFTPLKMEKERVTFQKWLLNYVQSLIQKNQKQSVGEAKRAKS